MSYPDVYLSIDGIGRAILIADTNLIANIPLVVKPANPGIIGGIVGYDRWSLWNLGNWTPFNYVKLGTSVYTDGGGNTRMVDIAFTPNALVYVPAGTDDIYINPGSMGKYMAGVIYPYPPGDWYVSPYSGNIFVGLVGTAITPTGVSTITVITEGSGTVEGIVKIPWGYDATFYIQKTGGGLANRIELDGNTVTPTAVVTFNVGTSDHTLFVRFDQIRIDHWIEGEGTIDSPASGFTDPGEYVVTVTPAEGYHLVSLDVDGTDIESGGTFNFSDDKTVWQIHAVFEPDKISLTVTVTSSGTDCAPSGEIIDGHVWIFPVNLGAYVHTAPLWVTVGSEGGTDTQTDAEAYDYGDPVGISAQCSDIRNRLASLTVNGDEKILSGELTTGYIIDMTATTAITIVATFIADAPCFIPQFPPPGTGGTPPSGPTPPIVPVPTNPPTEPPGTPPSPPPPAPPPGGGGDSGGGSGGGQYSEGVPKEDGGGEPPDFGPTRIFPPGWDRQTDMARMWIRWRDDNGEWSKEHPVDIGSPGDNEWPVWMPMRGDYSTRQWEIVITDRAPLVVVYLEEEVDGLDE